jgi:hypothetical protein
MTARNSLEQSEVKTGSWNPSLSPSNLASTLAELELMQQKLKYYLDGLEFHGALAPVDEDQENC